MEKVQLGTKVRRLGIERANVAEGSKCRVVLLDDCPRVKYIGWDEERKKKIELNQDLVIRYGFRPMTNFYYLVAKLNTDMNGNVVGDQFVVEYLQLSENLNNELADLIQEFGSFSSFTLSKVKKSGPDGKDFSYIKTTPSNYNLSDSLIQSIEKLKSDNDAIEAMWQLIDRATSISAQEYIELRESENGAKHQVALPADNHKPKQVVAHQSTPVMPQAPADFGADFAEADEFNGDGF